MRAEEEPHAGQVTVLPAGRTTISGLDVSVSTRSMIRPHGASVIPRLITRIPSRSAVKVPLKMHQN